MVDTTNARKVHECGGQSVVSFPPSWMREHGIAEGQLYVLEPTENGFQAVRVKYTTNTDD